MKLQKPRPTKPVAFEWYKPTQWTRLLEMSEDAGDLERTYLEWLGGATKRFQEMARAKIRVQRVDVDVEELLQWCQRKGLPVNARARAQFAGEKLLEDL